MFFTPINAVGAAVEASLRAMITSTDAIEEPNAVDAYAILTAMSTFWTYEAVVIINFSKLFHLFEPVHHVTSIHF